MDRSQLLHQAGQMVGMPITGCHRRERERDMLMKTWKIWDAIHDGTILSCPSLLCSFVIVSFADLKKYKFHYWFAFPAIHSDPQWVPVQPPDQVPQPHQDHDIDNLKGKHLSPPESTALVEAVQTWSYIVDDRQRGFFLARRARRCSDNVSPGDSETKSTQQDDTSNSNWQIASLSEYENGFFKNVAAEDRYFCFSDPSNYEQAPGWMLRNLLVLIKQRWGIERVQLIRYRDVHAKRDQGRSTVIQLESSSKEEVQTPKSLQTLKSLPLPKVTGWERNSTGKLAGRIVNLTEYMDPKRYDVNLEIPNPKTWSRELIFP